MSEPIFTPEFSRPFVFAAKHPIQAVCNLTAYGAAIGSIGAILAAPCALGIEALLWLRWGVWPGWSTEQVYRWVGAVPARSDWAGVQKLLDLYFALPAAVGLLVTGGVSLWASVWLITEVDEHHRTVQAGKDKP